MIKYNIGDIIKYRLFQDYNLYVGIIIKVLNQKAELYDVFNITKNEVDKVIRGIGYNKYKINK